MFALIKIKTFHSRLLKWYGNQKRDTPWRKNRDPYSILVSEFMLQQTQVKTVIPYFKKWMNSFPTIKRLAAASESDVLKHWEGLGYYSRARNLLKSAIQIQKNYSDDIRIQYRRSLDSPSLDENINTAVSMSNSEYVWIFGDDDLMIKDSLTDILNMHYR